MPAYAKLKSERQAFDGTDEQFLTYANETIVVWKPVDFNVWCDFCDTNGVTQALLVGAAASSHEAAIASQMGLELMRRAYTQIELQRDSTRIPLVAMCDGLVAAGVLTEELATALLNLGRDNLRRCAAWEWESVTSEDLAAAMAFDDTPVIEPQPPSPTVIAFMNNQVRPLAQDVRALKAAIDCAAVEWVSGISDLVPNDAEVIDDGRASEGVSRLSGSDVVGFVTQMLAIKAVLDGQGVSAIVQKPCVLPFRVR